MKIQNDSESNRRKRDIAVKIFLEKTNNYRKETLGEADFCGKAAPPEEGSACEAYEWAMEAREANAQTGEDMIEQ